MSKVLAVMAKTPILGTCKTRLEPLLGVDGALAAHIELTEQALETAARVGAQHDVEAVLWVTERDAKVEQWAENFSMSLAVQSGDDLGQKMLNVFKQHCDDSADQICLFGTDCPSIDDDYLAMAFDALDHHEVIFGPAEDGGYGLLAMTRPLTEVFENIPWSTDAVLATSIERLQEKGISYALLPQIWDVDEPEDWERYVRFKRARRSSPASE